MEDKDVVSIEKEEENRTIEGLKQLAEEFNSLENLEISEAEKRWFERERFEREQAQKTSFVLGELIVHL